MPVGFCHWTQWGCWSRHHSLPLSSVLGVFPGCLPHSLGLILYILSLKHCLGLPLILFPTGSGVNIFITTALHSYHFSFQHDQTIRDALDYMLRRLFQFQTYSTPSWCKKKQRLAPWVSCFIYHRTYRVKLLILLFLCWYMLLLLLCILQPLTNSSQFHVQNSNYYEKNSMLYATNPVLTFLFSRLTSPL